MEREYERHTLTDFINIVQSPGTTKFSKIKQIKHRVYSPATDYYKSLREKIIDVISESEDIKQINLAVAAAHANRREHYAAIASNMISWYAKQKNLSWLEPPRGYYKPNSIGIKVNPEIGFQDSDGKVSIIKLHMNKEALSKGKLEVAAYLFYTTLAPQCPPNTTFAFLDLHQGKLFPVKKLHDSGSIFLAAEIAYIEQIWGSA